MGFLFLEATTQFERYLIKEGRNYQNRRTLSDQDRLCGAFWDR